MGISNSVIPVKADILCFQAVPDPGVRGVTWTIFDSSKGKEVVVLRGHILVSYSGSFQSG